MGTTAEKLTYLNDTKQLLKENINSLGGNLTTEPFRQYASVLEGIYERLPKVSGIGASLSLSPSMVGRIKLNEIQGNTLQDGTPTPDTPIEIQNVTGLQNVSINNIVPSGYIPVDYIESSGTQYIDTGVIPTANTKIDLDFEYLGSRDMGWVALYGERGPVPQTFFGLYINGTTQKLAVNYANFDSGASSTTTINKNTKYNVKNDGGSFYLNNEKRTDQSTTNTLTTSDKTIYLFDIKLNDGLPQSRGMKAKIYQCKFYEGNTLIRNMIPCYRSYDNVLGLYDTVNNVFYTNQGSGSFTYGSVLGNTYEVNLGNIELNKIGDYEDSIKKSNGKNLFDKNNINEIRGTINTDSGIFTYSSTSMNYCFYMPCKPNTTYTIQKRNDGDTNRFKFASCSTEISTQESGVTNLTSKASDDSASSLTITTGPNDIYIMAQYYRSAETKLTKQQVLDSIMIEEGDQSTSYEPYGKVWYITKNIREYVYNNDLTENGISSSSVNFLTPILDVEANLTDIAFSSKSLCNMLTNKIISDTGLNGTTGTKKIRVNVSTTYGATYEAIKTLFANNNLSIYYVSTTPTYTTITNTTLIEQLESLYNAKSKNGTTNITITSENLSMLLNVGVLKGDA